MCKASPCGCTVITEEGRHRALGLILDGRYYRLTNDDATVIPGTVFFDSVDFKTLTALLGVPAGPEVLREVSESAKDRYCIPDGMKLELTEQPWESRRAEGVYYEIVFVMDDSVG